MAKKRNKGIFNKMREVWGNWRKGRSVYEREGHSELEAQHRRQQTWRNIGEFGRSLWNETNVSRRLESLLRKRSRAEKDERVREAKERIHERNVRVAKLTDSKGYSDFVKFQQKAERLAYMGLRHPEFRKSDNHSLEYYIGFQNGVLSMIEDDRKFFEDAVFGVEKEVQQAEEEQTKTKKK